MAAKKMSKKDLAKYKKILEELRNKMLHDVHNMEHNPNSEDAESRDLSGHVQHMADVATDMYDKEFNLGLASKEREVIQKIEAALKRIDDETYGICLGTNKPIKRARLDAIPYAEYSREYQEELENQGG